MRPTAVIDKSLLHAICELPDAELDQCFNAILEKFVIVVPSILVEEVWYDQYRCREAPTRATTNLVRCLRHLHNEWIAEPLDIAFQELVEDKPISAIPRPSANVMNSFDTLAASDPELHQWMIQTRDRKNWIIGDRLRQQREKLPPENAFLLAKPGELLTEIVWPEFLGILSNPTEKTKLLEGVLGEGFRYRNRDSGFRIDAAFARYTSETIHHYEVSTQCILTALVYFSAPLFKIATPAGAPRKLLSRTKQGQQNNLADEKYVQSALLVAALLTRDEGMRSAMDVFSEAGWWGGKIVFVDPRKNINKALETALLGQ